MKTNKQNPISLAELIDFNDWQKVQDNFAAIADIGLRTVDYKGKPITLPSRQPKLCNELLKDPASLISLCEKCLPTFLGGEAVVDKNLSFSCLGEIDGLYSFIVPLRLNKTRLLGYAIVGPVILVMRKLKEEYSQAAEKLNVDLEDLWSVLLEVKVASFQNIQSMLELLREICEYTLNLSYQNVAMKKEMVVIQSLAKLGKLLDALLEVAFEMSKADVGSIMFLDNAKEELSILASRGIPDKIVKNTRVKLGEGVSGVAAKEAASFIIDENTTDNRIAAYLNRPHLGSSMVLPIQARDKKVLGVMSLGVFKTSTVKFDKDNLRSLQKLSELVTTAISR